MKHKLIKISKPIWYFAIFLFIIFGTVALVRYGQGFIYDRETGEIISGGLVMMASSPRGADIYIDGDSNGRSPGRLRLPRGEYHIEMIRDGYRPWTKSIAVEPGQVVNAEYPLLIPTAIATTTLFNLDNLEIAVRSNDQEILAYIDSDKLYTLDIDNQSSEEILDLSLDFADYTPKSLEFSINDSSLLMVLNDASEKAHILVNLSSGSYQHLEEVLDIQLDAVSFSSVNANTLNNLAGGRLSRLEVSSSGASVSDLAEDVLSFSELDRRSMYIVTSSGISLVNSGEVIYELRRDRNYNLYSSTYDREPALILHDKDYHQVTILRNLGGKVTTKTLAVGIAEEVALSPAGRFLLMRSGSNYATYDLEFKQLTNFSMQTELKSMPNWYDEYRLLTVIDSEATIMEYDGANMEAIISADNYPVYGSSEEGIIYSFKYDSEGILSLQKSDL